MAWRWLDLVMSSVPTGGRLAARAVTATMDALASRMAGDLFTPPASTVQNLVRSTWYRGCSPSPICSEVSTTLTVSAGSAYEIFSDAVEIPRWLPIVQTARTLVRCPDGRPERVAFTRKLERGSLGYTLEYSYDPATLTIAWTTPAGSNVILTGEARFVALSTRACLMLYRLVIDLPVVDDLVSSELDRHPASQVVAEFREHLRRLC
jgi:hypothetical protein